MLIEDDECRHNPEAKNVRARSQIIPVSLIIAASFGFLLVVYLIIESGAADVARAMLVIGWWLIPITLFHLVPFAFSALSWRELLPASTRPHVITIIWIRWIRESINSLLPVASIGGDIASVRLARLRGVPGTQAAASMVLDITVGAATQLIFVMSGVCLLLMRSTERGTRAVAWAVLIGTGVFFAVDRRIRHIPASRSVCRLGEIGAPRAARAMGVRVRRRRIGDRRCRRSGIPDPVDHAARQRFASDRMGCRRG